MEESTSLVMFTPHQLIEVNKVRTKAREMARKREVPSAVQRQSPLPYLSQTDIRNKLRAWLDAQVWVNKVVEKEGHPAEYEFLFIHLEAKSVVYSLKGLLDAFLSDFYADGTGCYVHAKAPEGSEDSVAYLEAKYIPDIVRALQAEIIEHYTGLLSELMVSKL